MWARCVAEGGLLLLAIYNRTEHSDTWLRIKRMYHWAPAPFKKLLALAFHIRTFGNLILHGQNSPRFVREYVKHRGMTYFRDVEDGLGCLPYEYASVEKITAFLAPKCFELVHVKHAASHGCNEFVFRKLTPQKQG
jgi:hypothetical protein